MFDLKHVLLFVLILVLPWMNLRLPSWESVGLQSLSDDMLTLQVYLEDGDAGFNFPDLSLATQYQLDYELSRVYPEVQIKLQVMTRDKTNSTDEYVVEMCLQDENMIAIGSSGMRAIMFYKLESVHSNDLPFLLSQTILYHLLSAEIEVLQNGLKEEYLNSPLQVEYVLENLSGVSDAEFKIELANSTDKYFELLSRVFKVNHRFTDVSSGLANLVIRLNRTDGIRLPKSSSTIRLVSYVGEKASRIIEKELGLPANPLNNVEIKLAAAKRYVLKKGKDII